MCYQLKIPEEGSYQLTISYVGYQSVFRDIEPGNTSVEFNSALHIREKELQEVTVAAKIKFLIYLKELQEYRYFPEASFDFYTYDFPSMYSVVIEGLTNDGKIVRQVEKIRVE